MSAAISVGIIGCGYAAQVHLPAIRSLKGARVTALADSDPVRLQALADRYGVERRHLDWHELVHDRGNQVIAVLTPPYLHFEMTLAAVRAADTGKTARPEESEDDPARLQNLYVDPDFHRRGIGQALLEHARAFSPEHLWLYTHQANDMARAFYEKNGFVAERWGVSPPPESEPDIEYHWRPSARVP